MVRKISKKLLSAYSFYLDLLVKTVDVFTYTQIESVALLRFCNNLTPGSVCAMVRPKFDHKFMGSVSTTPILNTAEPLVQLKLKTYLACTINILAPDFIHFNMVTKTMVLSNVDAVSPVCNSLFCDRQPKTDCPCMEGDNRKSAGF